MISDSLLPNERGRDRRPSAADFLLRADVRRHSLTRSHPVVATWIYRHVHLEESPYPDGAPIMRPVVPLMRAPGTAKLRGVIDSGSPISAASGYAHPARPSEFAVRGRALRATSRSP